MLKHINCHNLLLQKQELAPMDAPHYGQSAKKPNEVLMVHTHTPTNQWLQCAVTPPAPHRLLSAVVQSEEHPPEAIWLLQH